MECITEPQCKLWTLANNMSILMLITEETMCGTYGIYGNSALSAQFFCKSKTAPKCKVY